jgi:ankyrin repeat protein
MELLENQKIQKKVKVTSPLSLSFKNRKTSLSQENEKLLKRKGSSFLGFSTFTKKLDLTKKKLIKGKESTKNLKGTFLDRKSSLGNEQTEMEEEQEKDDRDLFLISPEINEKEQLSPQVSGVSVTMDTLMISEATSPIGEEICSRDTSPRSDSATSDISEEKSTMEVRVGGSIIKKMFHSCLIGDFETLKKICEEHPDVDVNTIENKTSMLHSATIKNHYEIIELLVSKGANINILDSMERTPLHLAVSNGSKESVLTLLGSGCKVNERDKYGYSPMFVAVKFHKFDIADDLLLFNSDLNFKKIDGSTILHNCASHGNTKALEYLLKLPFNKLIINPKDSNGDTPFLKAIFHDELDFLTYFIQEKKSEIKFNSQNSLGQNIFHLAARKNSFKTLIYILSIDNASVINLINLPDSTSRKSCPIHVAIQNSSSEVFQILISNGVDINVKDSKGNTPLHYAIQNENIMYATVLLKGKAKQLKNNEGLTPKKMKKFLESK